MALQLGRIERGSITGRLVGMLMIAEAMVGGAMVSPVNGSWCERYALMECRAAFGK